MKNYDFNPYSLPREMLEAIGLVSAAAAQTENIVEAGIAGCIGIDSEYGGAITTHMAMPLRLSVLRSVAEIRIDDLDALDQLDLLLEQVEDAFAKRNDIVHHSWCIDQDTGEIFTVRTTARKRYEMDLLPATVDGVKGKALDIYRAGIELWQFLSVMGLLPALPPGRDRSHKSKAARKERRKLLGKT